MFDVYVNHWSFGLLKDISSIWEKLENFEFAPVQPGPNRFKKGNSIFTVTRLWTNFLAELHFKVLIKIHRLTQTITFSFLTENCFFGNTSPDLRTSPVRPTFPFRPPCSIVFLTVPFHPVFMISHTTGNEHVTSKSIKVRWTSNHSVRKRNFRR